MRAADDYAGSGKPDGQRTEDQPLPKPGTGPSMHDLVCEDIRDRWASGMLGTAPVAPAIGAVVASLQERKPSPAELWEQSGGNRDEYRRLLREHGHILAPGGEGYEPDAPRTLPCGWSPGKTRDQKGDPS